MARKRRRSARAAASTGIAGLTEAQERLLIYVAVVLIILLLFAVEPGFFLGVVLGIIGYRYYLDNYSKRDDAQNR